MLIEISDEEKETMLSWLNDVSHGEFGCASGEDRWRLCSYLPFTVEPERVIATGMDKLDCHLIGRSLNHLRTLLDRASPSLKTKGTDE